MALNKSGGYRYDLEDRAWLKAASMTQDEYDQAVRLAVRPATVDPRNWFKVRSQGQEGSCQGHDIAACGEACFKIASKQTTRFSPDAAYYLTQREDGITGDNGSTIAGGLKVATNIGFCPEEFMPYTDRYNPQDMPKNVKELCEPYKVKKFKIFNGPDYFAEAVEWIGLGLGGVSYGIDWGVTLDSRGVANWRASNGGGHAQACFGYVGEPDKDGLPQYLLPVNSWGDWGPLHGWYLWTRDIFNLTMSHRYSVVGGISDMASPAPRKIDWAEDYPS